MEEMSAELNLKKFEDAYETVKKVTLKTNLIYSNYFSDLTGNQVYIKPENLQFTGAYKVRGAYYKISTLSEEERQTALDLAWAVFSEYESPDYAPEGTEEFRKCLHDEAYLYGLHYYGAFYGEKLIGEIAIRPDRKHICFFFVDGRYHRRGIGTRMFRRLLEDYPNETITLNSSPYGIPFYKAIGFVPIDEEKTVNGIRFTPMKYEGK